MNTIIHEVQTRFSSDIPPINIKYVEKYFDATDNTGIYLFKTYRVVVLLENNLSTVFSNHIISTSRGDILCFRPDEIHYGRVLIPGIYRYMDFFIPTDFFQFITMDCSSIQDFLEHRKHKINCIHPSPKQRQQILELTENLKKLLTDYIPENNISIFVQVLNILLFCCNLYKDNKHTNLSADTPFCVTEALKYISQRYAEKITLEQIAENSFCSATYLSKMFRKYLGCTVYEHLTNFRILNAARLLRDGKSVTEVCYECGFNDCSNFIKTFKKIEGVTPLTYKKTSFNNLTPFSFDH